MAKLTQQERHDERARMIAEISERIEKTYRIGALEAAYRELLGRVCRQDDHILAIALGCTHLVLMTFLQRDDNPGPGRLKETEGG